MAANKPMTDTTLTQDLPTSGSGDQEICKYYLHGACRFGDSCFFSHAQAPAQQSSNIICKYFLAGNCSFGNRCFNKHVLPPRPKSQPIVSNYSDENVNSSSESNSTSTSPSSASTISNSRRSVNRNDEDDGLRSPDSWEAGSVDQEAFYQNCDNYNPYDAQYVEYLHTKETNPAASKFFCPYYEKIQMCPYESSCAFVHGNVCDICNLACLNLDDKTQNAQHIGECMKGMEKDMEEAFAVQRSSEKPCGICMEVVWDKEDAGDTRFGILENCNHVFCLPCIRKWRASKSYENKIVKACPECRVKSDFVTPSKFWFEDEESKKKIIQEYKQKLGQTACKYFKQGDGECPFGSKCFYLHQNKDGTLVELPEPTRRHRSNRTDFENEYSNVVTVFFEFSEDEDEDIDVIEFFRNSLHWENETSDSDESESLFELSNDLLGEI